jgi:hypothetical protein
MNNNFIKLYKDEFTFFSVYHFNDKEDFVCKIKKDKKKYYKIWAKYFGSYSWY